MTASRNARETSSATEKEPLPIGAYFDRMSAKPGSLSLLPADGRDWQDGVAITPHGIVSIYTQGRLLGRDPITRLDVVAAGRLHIATWERTFSDRFLLTVAKRFAASAAGAET
jgi:hypothetical protein